MALLKTISAGGGIWIDPQMKPFDARALEPSAEHLSIEKRASMHTWFRFYNSTHRHEKIRHLSNKLFRFWIIILEIASEHNGVLPAFEAISYETRLHVSSVTEMINELQRLSLIDMTDQGLMPHNWTKYQYKSDNVTERTKRFRERSGNVSQNVSGNGQTDSDQKRLRAENVPAAKRPLTLREREFCKSKHIIATHAHRCTSQDHYQAERETYCNAPGCTNEKYEEICEDCEP